MWMTRVSIANPVFATMLTLALLVVGALSYRRMPVDRQPDIDAPYVWVSADYPGASPDVVETEVTQALETALRGMPGLHSLSSTSSAGSAQLNLEFELGTESEGALQAVRDKLATLSLPRDVSAPQARRYNPEDNAIFSLAITSAQRSERELTELVDELVVPRLQGVAGVASASRWGGAEDEIRVQLQPAALRALGIGVEDVAQALSRENRSFAVGNIAQGRGEALISLEGKLADPRDFGSIIVAERAGAPVLLGELAQIERVERERTSMVLRDGQPVIGLQLFKSRDANTVAVVDGAREALARLGRSLPSDVHIETTQDESESIRSSIADLQRSLWEGALLTIAVVFLFLQSWRSTVITGIALPVSLIGTFAVLPLFGVEINIMTLLALSLSVGILVDDAIVVRENIVRHIALGADHRRASLEATREIGLAVLATTSTIVAVFLPVANMAGMIGQWFYDFGITVSLAVLISLWVSFTLDPMLSSLWPDPALRPERSARSRWLALPSRALEALAVKYRGALRWALAHRAAVVGLTLAACAGGVALVPRLGVEMVPQLESNWIQVQADVPPGSSFASNEAKARQIEAAVREFREVKSTHTSIYSGGGLGAAVRVELVPREQRELDHAELQQRLRARLQQIGGVELSVGGRGGKPIRVNLVGEDPQLLDSIASQLAERLRAVPGLVEVSTDRDGGEPLLAVELDRERASAFGLDLASVGDALQSLLSGRSATRWDAPGGERLEVVLRLPPGTRAVDLEQLPLASRQRDAQGIPRLISLRDVAAVVPGSAPRSIERRDLRRVTALTAGVQGRPAGDASRDAQAALSAVRLPEGYELQFGGVSEDLDETFGELMSALALGVLFIYLILASQFGSFVQPLSIMATLPLSLIGVCLSLLAAGSTINLFSMIGFLMLMGLVTKNGILLVDFIQHGLAQGKSHLEAALEAGSVRLRPIVMTTAAMIFGMVPLALSSDSDQRAPMAHAVIGGLLSSALLTLVVVPVLHSLLHQAGAWLSRRTGAASAASAELDKERAAVAGADALGGAGSAS